MNKRIKNAILAKIREGREDIANQLGIDPSEFEDSKGLGDMADRISDDMEGYENIERLSEDIFDFFLDNEDVSWLFTDTISGMGYDKKERFMNMLYGLMEDYLDENEEYLTTNQLSFLRNDLKSKAHGFMKYGGKRKR